MHESVWKDRGRVRLTAEQLDSVRSALSLSDQWIANALGVRRDTVHKWRTGVGDIPYRVPLELASALRDLGGEAGRQAEILENLEK
jgi:predicted transcriptional regulator